MTRSLANSPFAGVICALCGVTLAAVAIGTRSPERIEHSAHRVAFLELSGDVQHSVRLSDADFRAQSTERQMELRELAQATRDDAVMKGVLDRYSVWWTSLSQAEWDEFHTLSETEQVEFAVTGLKAHQRSEQPIRVDFPGPRNGRLPTLNLSYEEFGHILDATTADMPRSDAFNQELAELPNQTLRSLRLVLWLFESTREQREPGQLEARNAAFRDALLAHVQDERWKTAFNRKLSTQPDRSFQRTTWLMMTQLAIFGQATTTIGGELQKQFPVSNEQILTAFEAVSDKRLRLELMTLPPETARNRLASLARLNRGSTPEERLLGRYLRFEEERDGMFRFLTWGFGGPGGGPGGPGGGPGGPNGPGGFGQDRDGQRRGDRGGDGNSSRDRGRD